MAERTVHPGMGWLPDYPDFRDYTLDHATVKVIMQKTMLPARQVGKLPAAADLRPWCSQIHHQGALGSCTAHAGAALVEYFAQRAFGKHMQVSRLFLYKAARNLMHQTGDTGAFIRNTMGALVLFGIPPEEYWPYEIEDFEKEPPAFCYAFAQNYQTISYYRFDPPGSNKQQVLDGVKNALNSGLPSMFGFTVYNSISQSGSEGHIPYPTAGEKIMGGHAMVAVGYDDHRKIRNRNAGAEKTVGAFLIRNSWGTTWGDQGYGWLPYDYLLNGLAVDWWSVVKNEWIETGLFRP
jgi:C1A family cysteine protease